MTKKYIVAPHVTADLCQDCYLRVINPRTEMTALERSRGHLNHDTYTAIQPHIKIQKARYSRRPAMR